MADHLSKPLDSIPYRATEIFCWEGDRCTGQYCPWIPETELGLRFQHLDGVLSLRGLTLKPTLIRAKPIMK